MDKKKQPISTTKTFETAQGVVTYTELSADMIAPHLLKLLDEILKKKKIVPVSGF